MPALLTKTRRQGSSVVTTLPSEMVRRLGISAGDELVWVEDGMGGFRVTAHAPETAKLIAVHERIMTKYSAVFRRLAG